MRLLSVCLLYIGINTFVCLNALGGSLVNVVGSTFSWEFSCFANPSTELLGERKEVGFRKTRNFSNNLFFVLCQLGCESCVLYECMIPFAKNRVIATERRSFLGVSTATTHVYKICYASRTVH
jgi:hypothetical protein